MPQVTKKIMKCYPHFNDNKTLGRNKPERPRDIQKVNKFHVFSVTAADYLIIFSLLRKRGKEYCL